MSIEREPGTPLNTFIVRFWRKSRADKPCWRGQVQHVQSGECVAFADEDALLCFLRRWVEMDEGRPSPAGKQVRHRTV